MNENGFCFYVYRWPKKKGHIEIAYAREHSEIAKRNIYRHGMCLLRIVVFRANTGNDVLCIRCVLCRASCFSMANDYQYMKGKR